MISTLVSTSALKGSESLTETLDRYLNAGIRAVELGSGHPPFPDMLAELKRYPFTYAVHNYFPLDDPGHLINIASQDAARLAKTIQIAKQAITICHELGGGFYGIHAGYRSDLLARSLGRRLAYGSIAPYEFAFNTMVETLKELCDYAAPLSVNVVVENHVLAPFNLVDGENPLLMLCKADEIVRLVNAVQRSNFGILVDTGHIRVTAKTMNFDPADFIRNISPFIRLWHLSDNDGESDQTQPFTETAWFAPHIKELPDSPCVIESTSEDELQLKRMAEVVSKWRHNV